MRPTISLKSHKLAPILTKFVIKKTLQGGYNIWAIPGLKHKT